MDLNRQALLVIAITVLGPAAVWHGLHPSRLAETIAGQAVLPGARRAGRGALAWAGLVVVFELAALAVSVGSIFSSSGRLAGALLAAAGAAFVAYVVLLLRRDYRGDCGCTPVAAAVTGLSVVPGGVLLAAGLVLAADPSLGDTAFARTSGGVDTAVALAAAGVLGALVSLLPASALVGDARRLQPAAGTGVGFGVGEA